MRFANKSLVGRMFGWVLVVTCLLGTGPSILNGQEFSKHRIMGNAGSPVRFLSHLNPYIYYSTDDRVVQWNLLTQKKQVYPQNICQTHALSISQPQRVVAAGSDCYLSAKKTVYDFKNTLKLKMHSYSGLAQAAGLDRSGNQLMIVGADGLVYIYQKTKNSYKKKSALKLDANATHGLNKLVALGFDKNLKYVAMRNWSSYYVYIYELNSGKLMHKTQYYLPPVNFDGNAFSFSEDSSYYFDSKRIRKTQTGELVASIQSKTCCILRQSAFSSDFSYLALLKHSDSQSYKAGDAYSTIEIYALGQFNAPKPVLVDTFQSTSKITTMGFSSDHSDLMFIGLDNGNLESFRIRISESGSKIE